MGFSFFLNLVRKSKAMLELLVLTWPQLAE